MKILKILARGLLDLIFPIYCVGCKKEGVHCCEECYKKIEVQHNKLDSAHIQSVFAATYFQETSLIAKLIHRFKYERAQEIATKLALLHMKCGTQISNSVLIPVPLHKRRENFRGFNQSLLLCKEYKKLFSITYADILERKRYTRPQVELNGKDRPKNVKDAFIVKSNIPLLSADQTYFIVDDVYTTGATMNECAKALASHGARKIYGLVIARAKSTQ